MAGLIPVMSVGDYTNTSRFFDRKSISHTFSSIRRLILRIRLGCSRLMGIRMASFGMSVGATSSKESALWPLPFCNGSGLLLLLLDGVAMGGSCLIVFKVQPDSSEIL